MTQLEQKISAIGAVPVIKLDDVNDAEPLAKALYDGGVKVAEVTFRAAGAPEVIHGMKSAFPDMIVGAGTVLTRAQIDEAVAAGAEFIVSPGFNPKNVSYCVEHGIADFPGCTTASEIELALELGLEVVKFFPAEQSGGLAKIKALAGPFANVKFMPTGGISLKNLGEYMACKSVAACGGTFMCASADLKAKNWSAITETCVKSLEIIRAARGE